MTDPTLDVKALVRDLIDACIDYGCTEQGDEETEAEQRMVKANSALLTRITAQQDRIVALEQLVESIEACINGDEPNLVLLRIHKLLRLHKQPASSEGA